MSFKDTRLQAQLYGVSNCPHCGVSAPVLMSVWQSPEMIPRADDGIPARWGVYRCTTCGAIVSAMGVAGDASKTPYVVAIFPEIWQPDEAIPEQAKRFLSQAQQTQASPDASVVMSAAAVDSMLKQHGLSEGSLFKRIDEAVEKGVLTSGMATWAHQIRIDSNNPRHADAEAQPMTVQDAKRALDFAKAIAEILYVLPARMPGQDKNQA